jgi:hypothetical protein
MKRTGTAEMPPRPELRQERVFVKGHLGRVRNTTSEVDDVEPSLS